MSSGPQYGALPRLKVGLGLSSDRAEDGSGIVAALGSHRLSSSIPADARIDRCVLARGGARPGGGLNPNAMAMWSSNDSVAAAAWLYRRAPGTRPFLRFDFFFLFGGFTACTGAASTCAAFLALAPFPPLPPFAFPFLPFRASRRGCFGDLRGCDPDDLVVLVRLDRVELSPAPSRCP